MKIGTLLGATATALHFPAHCEFNQIELKQLRADIFIAPVAAREGADEIADRWVKHLVPMRNGELQESGLLAPFIQRTVSEAAFARECAQRAFEVVRAPTGAALSLRTIGTGG